MVVVVVHVVAPSAHTLRECLRNPLFCRLSVRSADPRACTSPGGCSTCSTCARGAASPNGTRSEAAKSQACGGISFRAGPSRRDPSRYATPSINDGLMTACFYSPSVDVDQRVDPEEREARRRRRTGQRHCKCVSEWGRGVLQSPCPCPRWSLGSPPGVHTKRARVGGDAETGATFELLCAVHEHPES